MSKLKSKTSTNNHQLLREAIVEMVDCLDPISDKDLMLRLFRMYCLVGTPQKLKPTKNHAESAKSVTSAKVANLNENINGEDSDESPICPKCKGDLATMNIFPDSDFIDGGEVLECVDCDWRSLSPDETKMHFTLCQLLEFVAAHNYPPVKFQFDILGRATLEYWLEVSKNISTGIFDQIVLKDEDIGETYEYTLDEFKGLFKKFLVCKMEVCEFWA